MGYKLSWGINILLMELIKYIILLTFKAIKYYSSSIFPITLEVLLAKFRSSSQNAECPLSFSNWAKVLSMHKKGKLEYSKYKSQI